MIPEAIREDVLRVVEDDALSMKLLEVSRNQEVLPEASEETLEDAIKTETDQWQEPAQVVPLALWVPLALRNLGSHGSKMPSACSASGYVERHGLIILHWSLTLPTLFHFGRRPARCVHTFYEVWRGLRTIDQPLQTVEEAAAMVFWG